MDFRPTNIISLLGFQLGRMLGAASILKRAKSKKAKEEALAKFLEVYDSVEKDIKENQFRYDDRISK